MKKIKSNLSPKQIILYSVIVLVIAVIVYFVTTMGPSYIKDYQKTIDSAQHNIDSLQAELDLSDQMIDSMSIELTVLERQNEVLKEKVVDIKKESNEKINAVNKLNNTELQHFFTDRYQ